MPELSQFDTGIPQSQSKARQTRTGDRRGDSGPAIELGKPADSLLIMAVRGSGLSRMPPDKSLTGPEIATLERWISKGAPWPQRQVTSPPLVPMVKGTGSIALGLAKVCELDTAGRSAGRLAQTTARRFRA